MKTKKPLIWIILGCIVVGVIYAIASLLPEQEAQIVLIGVAVCIVIVWMVTKMWNMVHLSKKISAPTHLLYEDKRPDLYVAEMEKILPKISAKQQKDLIRINISAGYLYNGEFEKTLETLEQVAVPGQPEVNQILYYAYRVMAYFLGGQKNSALEELEQQRKLLKKYDSTQAGITNNILVLYSMEKLLTKEYEQARNLLKQLQERKVSSVLQDMIDYLLLECYKNEKMDQEYSELKEQMLQRTLVPVVRSRIKA